MHMPRGSMAMQCPEEWLPGAAARAMGHARHGDELLQNYQACVYNTVDGTKTVICTLEK